MSILFDEKKQIFQLNTEKTSYQMEVDEIGTLLHTYYGIRLNTFESLSYTLYTRARSHASCPPEMCDPEFTERRSAYTLEVRPQEMSAFGLGDYRTTGIRVRQADGTSALQLRFSDYRICDGKYRIEGLPSSYDDRGDCETLEITLTDLPTGIKVTLYFGVFEKANVITRATVVENGGKWPVFLEKCASLNLDFTSGEYDMIDFYGSWARERYPERRPVMHGMQSFGSVRGASGALFNPSMMLLDHTATDLTGNAYGFALVYSGSHLFEAERSVDNQTRVVIGIHPEDFTWELQPGETFSSPEAVMTYSDEGTSGVTCAFHNFVRTSIMRGKWRDQKRPLLLNSWEGVYFDFTGEKLIQMAKDAKDAGIELFVLDDGWFGRRDTALGGLGDWYPNEKKLGMTIRELGKRIREAGTQFGLWFEPEMISKDSDLYKEHPDWAIAIPGRAPHLGGQKLLLDVSRREVQEYLISSMEKIISEAGLAYIKWDYNRCMADRYAAELPPERQGELSHRYYLGVYRILETLLHDFPDLLIEGCASGGARFDMGMLCYTPQIWVSDDTDAIERLMIQYGTQMIYPSRAMGTHVSAVPNHQTGRITPMKTRATVAMSGTFGYELDIQRLTQDEKDEMRLEIGLYHELYDLIQFGDYYSLIPPTRDVCTVWEHVKKDGSQALISVVFQHARPCPVAERCYVQGLKDDRFYRILLLREDDRRRMSVSKYHPIYDGSTVISGKALRVTGLNVPFAEQTKDMDFNSWMLLITEEPQKSQKDL